MYVNLPFITTLNSSADYGGVDYGKGEGRLWDEVKPRTRFATLCARARAYYSDIMLRADRKRIVND